MNRTFTFDIAEPLPVLFSVYHNEWMRISFSNVPAGSVVYLTIASGPADVPLLQFEGPDLVLMPSDLEQLSEGTRYVYDITLLTLGEFHRIGGGNLQLLNAITPVISGPELADALPSISGQAGVPLEPYDASIGFVAKAPRYSLLPGTIAVPWAAIDPATGIVTGIPTASVAGTFRVHVRNPGGTAEQSVTVLVAGAADGPQISGASTARVRTGSSDVGVYTASETVEWSLAGVDASAFSISDSGALSFTSAPSFGAPSDADEDNVYNVTVIATDLGGNAASRGVAVTVGRSFSRSFSLGFS